MTQLRKAGLLAASLIAVCLAACGGDSSSKSSGLNHGPGYACKSSADCEPGLSCATEDPNGQCIKPCTPGNDASCGDSTLACNHEGHCYWICKDISNCARAAEGYVCKDDTPPRGVKFCDVP
jgi:hypothetical protein